MGEYAIRKSDGVEVKIGTCEDMYYIRFEDRDKVSALPGSVDITNEPDGSRFRLPFPDEDDVPVGQYDVYNRGFRLYRMVEGPPYLGTNQEPTKHCEDWKDESAANHPGVIQLHHQESSIMTPQEQSFYLGRAWEAMPEPKRQFIFQVVRPDFSVENYTVGPHTPSLNPEDVQLTHRLWLQLTRIPGLEKLHHADVISLALTRLVRDYARHEHEVVAEFKSGKDKRFGLPTPLTPDRKPSKPDANSKSSTPRIRYLVAKSWANVGSRTTRGPTKRTGPGGLTFTCSRVARTAIKTC